MIKNDKLTQKIGETKPSTLPSMYDSKLFARRHPASEGSQYTKAVSDSEEDMTETKKAMLLLEEFAKADMSAGRTVLPPEKQARSAYEHSFARQPMGVSGSSTPDLPDRGRDWHGTVPGVPDEPQDTDDDKNKDEEYFQDPKPVLGSQAKSLVDEACKALAGAPTFDPGPVMPPREIDYLLRNGFTLQEILTGNAHMTSPMRAQFNRDLATAVQKSIMTLQDKIESD
jgi:hypothetical protein